MPRLKNGAFKATVTTTTHTHVRDYPGEPVPERYNQSSLLKQETVSGSGISCTLLQTDNHASTPPVPVSLQA